MENATESFLAAIEDNPGSHFPDPAAVVQDPLLSDEAKKRILLAWEDHSRRLAVATEEGMGGGEPSRLAEVAEAMARLGVESERPPTPAKIG